METKSKSAIFPDGDVFVHVGDVYCESLDMDVMGWTYNRNGNRLHTIMRVERRIQEGL